MVSFWWCKQVNSCWGTAWNYCGCIHFYEINFENGLFVVGWQPFTQILKNPCSAPLIRLDRVEARFLQYLIPWIPLSKLRKSIQCAAIEINFESLLVEWCQTVELFIPYLDQPVLDNPGRKPYILECELLTLTLFDVKLNGLILKLEFGK